MAVNLTTGSTSLNFPRRALLEALTKMRTRQGTAERLKECHVRAGIEGTISQGVRAFGLRRSRYVGFAKTASREVIVAAGMNVQRVTS